MLSIDRARIPRIRITKWDPNLSFNLPANVSKRIQRSQAAATARIARARERSDLMNSLRDTSLRNAITTQQRISSPGYQEEVRRKKANDKLMQIQEQMRGYKGVQSLKNKGLMNLQKDEQKFEIASLIRQGIIPDPNANKTNVMTPQTRLGAIQQRTRWIDKAFSAPGLRQTGPLTNREINTAWSRPIIPGAGTNLGMLSGLTGIDKLLRGTGKTIYKYFNRPTEQAYNWLMSPY